MLTTEAGRSRQAPWDPAHVPTLPACEGGTERPWRLSDTPGSVVPLACGITRPLRRPSAPAELHWAHGASSSPPSCLGPGGSGQAPGCTHTEVLMPPNPPRL